MTEVSWEDTWVALMLLGAFFLVLGTAWLDYRMQWRYHRRHSSPVNPPVGDPK